MAVIDIQIIDFRTMSAFQAFQLFSAIEQLGATFTTLIVFGLIPLNRLKLNSNILFKDYFIMICVPIWYLSTFLLSKLGGFTVHQLTACGCICRLTNGLFIHLGCFLYITTCFLAFCRRKQFFIDFTKSLGKIDENIDACWKVAYGNKVHTFPNRKIYYSKWLLTVMVFCFAIINDIIQAIKYFEEYFFLATMTTIFPYFIGCIVQGQFIHYVSTLSKRFIEVNHLLNKIKKDCTRNCPTTLGDKELNILNNNESVKLENLTDLKDTFFTEKLRQNTSCYSFEGQLVALFKLHSQILSLSRLTNTAWAPQCVWFMVTNFVMSVCAIFLTTKVIIEVGGKDPLLDYVVHTYIIWSVVTSLVAYILLHFCNNARSYSNKSVQILHEITQKRPIFMMGNDFNYSRMKACVLQFLQWEKYFQFNGIGLFILDYTFIFSVIGSAASYLIVLLQIDISMVLQADGLG